MLTLMRQISADQASSLKFLYEAETLPVLDAVGIEYAVEVFAFVLDDARMKAVPPIYSIHRRNLGILHHHRIPFPACIRSSKSSRTARRSTQKSLPCDSGSCPETEKAPAIASEGG